MLFGFDPNALRGSRPTLDANDVRAVLAAASVRFLGSGAFGESWAFTRSGSTLVAKVLLDPGTTSRQILREVDGLTRVSSPHVVRLVEVQVPTLSIGPRLALIFEFIDGGDVGQWIERGQWPTPDEVLAFTIGALRGLVTLHEREVVHRDVKPENIALRGGDWGQPVLLDLGLGRLLDASTLTTYPARVGTAPFMAPEIIEGRAARKGADLWSLGVVAHLLLARQHPFYPDPSELLDPDDAYDRLVAGPPALPTGTAAPLLAVVARLLSATSYARGSATRALRDLEP
jgi:serine/threonine protein kinase